MRPKQSRRFHRQGSFGAVFSDCPRARSRRGEGLGACSLGLTALFFSLEPSPIIHGQRRIHVSSHRRNTHGASARIGAPQPLRPHSTPRSTYKESKHATSIRPRTRTLGHGFVAVGSGTAGGNAATPARCDDRTSGAQVSVLLGWNGTAVPNAASKNRTEQLLAEPGVQQFVDALGGKSWARCGNRPRARSKAKSSPKNCRDLLKAAATSLGALCQPVRTAATRAENPRRLGGQSWRRCSRRRRLARQA